MDDIKRDEKMLAKYPFHIVLMVKAAVKNIEEVKYSPVSRHYPVVLKIEPSLPLTFRPAIF